MEGYNDTAVVFRSTAEGETGHAHGHLEYLEEAGDPATGLPIGKTTDNLAAAIAGETHEYTECIPRWPAPRAKKASRKSPSGSRRWQRPRSLTPAASSGRWTK